MARWGLRWIFCWISVFLTACTQMVSSTPSPTEKVSPQSTINVYSATDTVPQNLSESPDLTQYATRLMVSDVLPFELGMPMCFSTPAASLVCLGYVENTQDLPISNIIVEVILRDTDGRTIGQQTIMPMIDPLMPSIKVPYRVVFQEEPSEMIIAEARIIDERAQSVLVSPMIVPLELTLIDWQGRDFRVQGSITNNTIYALENIQIVLMIQQDDQIIGFRMTRLEEHLVPNMQQTFEMRIAPLIMPDENVIVSGYAVVYPNLSTLQP